MYTDITAEWRLLASIVDNPEVMHSITKEIFTDERQFILEAMRGAYIKYGELTYEGLRLALKGDVPAELTSGVVATVDLKLTGSTLLSLLRQL